MVLQKKMSQGKLFGRLKRRNKRTSRDPSDSLSLDSLNSSYTRLDQLDNPLLATSFSENKKLTRQSSILSKTRKSIPSRRRRRRCESSKNSEVSKSTGSVDSDTDHELESCFDNFVDLELDQYVLYNKKGEEVPIKFGHDYIRINKELVLYEHIIYWGHTKTSLKISYVANMSTAEQGRVDVALYPNPNEKLCARDFACILQKKVATLYKEVTGCSQDEALGVASKEVGKAEVAEVLNRVDITSERQFAQLCTQDI